MARGRWLPASLVLLSACSSGGDEVGPASSADAAPPPDAGPARDAGRVIAEPGAVEEQEDEGACPSLFAQDTLPEWRVTLTAPEWEALEDEFYNRVEREEAGLDRNPYHFVEHIIFDDGSGPVEVPHVLIRLKGQSSWLQTIEYDENPKMQFVIAFNEIYPDGRFRGVRKVELDMPRTDWTFLRQRLALHTMRQVGQDAQCANNAELYINGEYYGLFTHLERLDKEFLQRVYGKEDDVDDGDLWKAGYEIRTNEDSHSDDRINAFWSASTVSELGALADLEDAVQEWASEAILPHADGYHIGRPNYFLYDHPLRGFLWLPTDLDTAFDYYPHYLDVAFPECAHRNYAHWVPYAITLGDAYWMDRYIAAIVEARQLYSAEEQAELVSEWSDQIAAAAQADPHKPFTVEEHEWALTLLRDHLFLRAGFLDDWVACREDGQGQDWDEDGTVFCFDCTDQDPEIHPAQSEVCNGIDDDCDGFLDEGPQSCAGG